MEDYSYLFNLQLIRDFRDKYTSPDSFVYFYYYENNKKDLWSKICSATDWIEVSITDLQNVNKIIRSLRRDKGLNNSLILFHFISTIAMLNSSIKNIWIAFYSKIGKYYYPFKGDRHIFNGKIVKNVFTRHELLNHDVYREASDYDYFSKIRSFFGVHGSNGNSKTYIDSHSRKHTIRFFSNWSADVSFDGKTYTVMMYCNNKGISKYFHYCLRINIYKLIKFAYLRYKSLHLLARFIDYLHKKVINYQLQCIKTKLKRYQLSTLEILLIVNNFTRKSHFMESYYFNEMTKYIIILKLLSHKSELNHFSYDDAKKIKKFSDFIRKHVIRDYYFAIKHLNPSFKSKYIESIDNLEYKWLFNKEYNPYYNILINCIYKINNKINYSYGPYIHTLDILIKKGFLPCYVSRLSHNEVLLLILARTFADNYPSIINSDYLELYKKRNVSKINDVISHVHKIINS